MAPLALACSLLLSALILFLDSRNRREVSAAAWLPTLLVLMLGSRPVSLWLSGGVYEEGGPSPADQIFYFTILLGSLAILGSRPVRWGGLLAENLPLAAMYAFFVVSILWSGDPEGSLKRVGKDMGMAVVAGVLLTEPQPLQAIGSVFVRCAAILFPLSIVLIKYFPDLGRAYSMTGELMLTGVTTQKNTLGEMAMICCLFLIWDYIEHRPPGQRWRLSRLPWDRLALLAMGLWLLSLSQSKTSLVCLALGVLLAVRSGWLASRPVGTLALAGALAAPFLLFSAQRFKSFIEPLVQSLGRDMTFTGRTEIWDLISLNTVNPMVGAGFWNFWGGPGGAAISLQLGMTGRVPNAHCGFLDIYLDGGFVGIFLVFVLLAIYGRRLTGTNSASSNFDRLRFAILVVMILYNLSESTLFRPSMSWFMTLLAVLSFPVRLPARGPVRQPVAAASAQVEMWGSPAVSQP